MKTTETNTQSLQELTSDECDQVGGGVVLLGTTIAISTGGVVAAGSTGKAMAAMVAAFDQAGWTDSTGGGDSGAIGDVTDGDAGTVSSGMGGPSDYRIKTAIEEVGYLEHLGLTVYAWSYINHDATRYVGVMAQDVLANEEIVGAVFVFEDGEYEGYYGVNYAMLGLNLVREDQFDGNVESLIAWPMCALG